MNDKVDLILEIMKSHKDETNSRLDSIDDNLRDHMRRTDILEKLHMDNEVRIEQLEEPRKALKLFVKIAAGIGVVSGAIYTISRII